jgi:hypothetical protein
MKFLAHQDDRSPQCPSCLCCEESCPHIARCPETDRVQAFEQSTQAMDLWLGKNKTHPNLQSLLFWYLHGKGTIRCSACSEELNIPPIIHEFAVSLDIIGWDIFVMGVVSSKLLLIQSTYLLQCNLSSQVECWILGVTTQLLQATHSHWIYRSVLVHNRTTCRLISSHKEDLLKEIKHQLTLGQEGLAAKDQFLLECNFDELTSTSGKHQEY